MENFGLGVKRSVRDVPFVFHKPALSGNVLNNRGRVDFAASGGERRLMRSKDSAFLVQGPEMSLRKADMNEHAIAVIAAVNDLAVSGEVRQHATVGDAGFDLEIGEGA